MCLCTVWDLGTHQGKGSSSRGHALGSVNLAAKQLPEAPQGRLSPLFYPLCPASHARPHPVTARPHLATAGTRLAAAQRWTKICLATGHGTRMRPGDWQFGRAGRSGSCPWRLCPSPLSVPFFPPPSHSSRTLKAPGLQCEKLKGVIWSLAGAGNLTLQARCFT